MTFNLWGGNVLLTLKKREKNTSSHVPNKIWMWSRILFLQNSNAFRIRSNHASWRIFVQRRGWVSKRKAWKQGSQKCYKMAENTTMAQTTSPPPLLWRLTWNAELTALEDGPWRLRQHHHPPANLAVWSQRPRALKSGLRLLDQKQLTAHKKRERRLKTKHQET